VSTFTRKYARGVSGVIRSWRFQPTARSAAMRPPQESIAPIVPNDASPTM
jgi:hypothetical protein